jgi:GT2 family glycosyltransferase
MKTMNEAAVVVCTRNRSVALARACEAVLEVDFDPRRWEMLIVDNSSTDDTADVARSVAEAHPTQVRVVVEEEIGLSAARNTGIAATDAEIVAFIDDDAFPEQGWLTAIVKGFRRPEVMCVGGPVAPLLEGELPPWFRGRFLPYLTVWDLGDEEADLRYNEYPRGANMAFRRSGLEAVGGFSTHLGRKGASLLSCEEIELCLRLERAGWGILYRPDARVRHLTPAERITPDWMRARFSAQGRSEAIINWMHGGIAGLRTGLRATRRHAANAQRNRALVGDVFADSHRHTVRGYYRGLLDIVSGVRRYRPPNADLTLAPWRPFD